MNLVMFRALFISNLGHIPFSMHIDLGHVPCIVHIDLSTKLYLPFIAILVHILVSQSTGTRLLTLEPLYISQQFRTIRIFEDAKIRPTFSS